MNLLVLGTCRAHRIFLKDKDGVVYDNTHGKVTPIFSHCGYLHTAFEIKQVLDFFLQNKEIDFSNEICKLIFRKEPIRTTPGNRFSMEIENAIVNELVYQFPDLPEYSSVLLEVSSLQFQKHDETGFYLHTNPNFVNNYGYPEIYPEGYYHKAGYSDEVTIGKMDQAQIENVFSSFSKHFKNKKVFVMGHLVDPLNRNPTRATLNELLKKSSSKYGFNYIDTEPFVQRYGFLNLPNGSVDIHHLSHEGECKLGEHIIENLYNE